MALEPWQIAFRVGIAPQLTDADLEALEQGLAGNDDRLIQGQTAAHAPGDPTVLAACAVGYCGWRGRGIERADELEDFFQEVCIESDNLIGGINQTHWFANWFDEQPRAVVFPALLAEVRLELNRREGEQADELVLADWTCSGPSCASCGGAGARESVGF